jgi:3-oxoacyl-[acyl-carrier protein] reductase
MTILVTGSDGSLGIAICESFRDHEQVIGIPMDMMKYQFTIEESINEAFSKVPNGRIDKVINNHGINHLSWIGQTLPDDEQILLQNVMGPYWVINSLVAAGQVCRAINIASATYRVPQRCTSLYCASKAALVQMTKVMARELAPKGWVINALAPGLIEDTIMAHQTNQQVRQLRGWGAMEANAYALNMVPMDRYTNKAEVVDAIWKILDLPDYINGTVIDMMGGV